MTTTPSPAANAGRAAYRILKAVISLIALTVAVAGLPYLLAWATPVIWAATHDDLTHLLDRQDTGAVVLLLLAAVGWIGWAQFTFCAVRELIAQLRGRTWHAPHGLGTSQRAAALLIGSILVLLPTGTALASDAQATPSATAAHQPGQPARSPQATSAPSSASTTSAPSAAAPTTYTVKDTRPAQSLWGIAERELGDGERWREIAALNQGRTMADGDTFQPSSFLQPGWQLLMPDPGPADGIRTQQAATAPAAETQSEHVVTVRPGDYLSKIAEKELGDGGAWPALFEASRGTHQPDGLPAITNPDVIYAGQHVTVPGATANEQPSNDDPAHGHSEASTPPARQAPRNGQETDSTATADQTPGAPTPATSAPTTPDRTSSEQQAPDRGASSSTPSPAASSAPTASAAPHASGSAVLSPAAAAKNPSTTAERPPGLRTVLGAGALLAAAITAALALRRALQRRRREPGQKIAIAAETSPAEALLAAAAEPGGAVRLDLALRTMAHHLSQDEAPVSPPSLRAARIGSRTVQILPEDLALEPHTPFVSGTGGWWTLAANAVLLDEDAARDVPAPYPGLVTIGSAEDGDLVLVDLARVPALLLDGNPVHITEVCTSIALELGMSPWAGEVEVVAVGFGDDLPQLLPTARIAHMRQPSHALRDVGERLLEAHQMPETSRQPYLVLCTASLDADAAWGFADIIDKAGAVPVTLVAPASSAAAHFPEAEILNASLDTPQRLESVGTDITVQRLDRASYLQITTALKVSAQPAHPAEGAWRDVPAEPDHIQKPEDNMEATHDPAAVASAPSVEDHAHEDAFPALLAATTSPSSSPLQTRQPRASADADRPRPVTAPDAAPAEDSDGADSDPGPRETRISQPPEIRVLGPVTVTGVDSNGHGQRIAQLATLLYFRPGRSAHIVCSDMDPVRPWTLSTLHARLGGLRRALGNNADGIPYVPRRQDPYHLSPGVRCDWTRFEELVERALPRGQAGLHDLEEALALVQGPPFAGKPLPWAEPYQQEMITRIIDVAHTVATYRTPAGPHHDLTAARRAVACGLDVDQTAELLYRDWLRIEHTAGNRQGLHTAITRVQQVNRTLDFSLELETEQLINELLDRPGCTVDRGR
ncbi:hypothetical protein AB0454_43030 [Streptomyces sp. NPDC093509]|uniref:hypothetical protein n=1 Tax=Streptomyces sp. NPDC093509 TaxID=3154982 RepID=UPI00344F0A03